jgi:hypothetical protein
MSASGWVHLEVEEVVRATDKALLPDVVVDVEG